jgi:hypothetical protein
MYSACNKVQAVANLPWWENAVTKRKTINVKSQIRLLRRKLFAQVLKALVTEVRPEVVVFSWSHANLKLHRCRPALPQKPKAWSSFCRVSSSITGALLLPSKHIISFHHRPYFSLWNLSFSELQVHGQFHRKACRKEMNGASTILHFSTNHWSTVQVAILLET